MTDVDTYRPFDASPTPEWQELMSALGRWIDSLDSDEGSPTAAELEHEVGSFIRAVDLADQNCDGERQDPNHPIDVVLYPHRLVVAGHGGVETYFKCTYCGRLNTNGIRH